MARADRRVDGRTGPAGQVERQAGDGLSCGTPETNGSRVRHPCCRARRPGGSDRGTARPLASPWPTFPHMAYSASGLFPRRSPDAEPRRSDSIEAPGFGPPRSYGRTNPRRPHRTDAQAAPPPYRPRRQHHPHPPPDRPGHQQAQNDHTGKQNSSPGKTPANSRQTKAQAQPKPKPHPKPNATRPAPRQPVPPTGTVSRQPASPEPTSPRPPVGPRPTWPARCRRPRPSRAPAARYPTGAATRVRWRRVRAPRR